MMVARDAFRRHLQCILTLLKRDEPNKFQFKALLFSHICTNAHHSNPNNLNLMQIAHDAKGLAGMESSHW